MNRKSFVAVLVIVCLLVPSLAWSYDQKEVLRGLTGVKVVIENIPPDIERLGLTKKDIQSDVELKLRKIGIKVYPDFKPPSMTTLYITVNTFNPPQAKSIIAYSINIMLFETVYLKRDIGTVGDLKEVRAADWNGGTVGLVGTPHITDIRKRVELQLDRFISDYLAVNNK